MKFDKKLLVVLVVVIALISVFFVFRSGGEENGFEINTFSIKTVLKHGETATYPLKITNFEEGKNFMVSVKGEVEELVSLSEEEFFLEKGQEKVLDLTFDEIGVLHGVYVGLLEVAANGEDKKIPLVLEIQDGDGLVATSLNIASAYKEVLPGEETVVTIKIFNLNDTRAHTVESLYEIKNLKGDTISSEKESIVMESELVLSKTIALPKKMDLGDYVFTFRVDFEGSIATSSYLFEVVDGKKAQNPIVNTNMFIIVILVFLVGILVLISYMIYERRTLLLQLKRQHSVEMSGSLRKVNERKRELVARASPSQKKNIKKKFKDIKKKVVRTLKEKHKKQRVEFKKLRKTNKKGKMQKKLDEWEKQGFNVNEFLIGSKKIKKSKGSDVKSLEKKGYDVSAIKK